MPANVFDEDWDQQQSQPGFTWNRLRVGTRLGAEVDYFDDEPTE